MKALRLFRFTVVTFLFVTSFQRKLVEASEDDDENIDTSGQNDITVSYSIPKIEERLRSLDVVVDLKSFKNCSSPECTEVCGNTKHLKSAYCDKRNTKLCMCDPNEFRPSEMLGKIIAVDRRDVHQANCSIACNKRNSYGRIWTKEDKTKRCLCLQNQMTDKGTTLCDPMAQMDICDVICQTDSGWCAFNGVCLCRNNWQAFFSLLMPNTRKQIPQDESECSNLCSAYHHDYIGRYYDSKLHDDSTNKKYGFREKYCLCGDWLDLTKNPQTTAILNQGFQLCTGLKCKQRCGMDEAMCEKFRRGCLCPRENIVIGRHLWSRLPTPKETKCYETCSSNGYDARVIEWNPFLKPENIKFEPIYRHSAFQYLYDGKFCHCIKSQIDMHQYRPCTDELCRMICGHEFATCDRRTSRACFCQTHHLNHNLGRLPDPGEINCDIACRYGLYDAMILDIKWEIDPPTWGVRTSKYCGCIQKLTLSGLTHCDPFKENECSKYCGNPKAYCTQEKYCYCGIVQNILSNPMIRLGNGKEQDECGEKCRSWLWPLAEDTDSKPYIYDESLAACASDTTQCPVVDTSPWKPEKAGVLSLDLDSRPGGDETINRRFCLCAKTTHLRYKPGNRLIVHMEPERIDSSGVPCILNHTCAVVGKSLHIIS